MSAFLLVFSTASSSKEASRLASILLKERLAACINILPGVQSHYWWKGKKEKSREVMLLIKTRAKLFAKVQKTLQKYHSYSVPEVLAVRVTKGSRDYLSWLDSELRSPNS